MLPLSTFYVNESTICPCKKTNYLEPQICDDCLNCAWVGKRPKNLGMRLLQFLMLSLFIILAADSHQRYLISIGTVSLILIYYIGA